MGSGIYRQLLDSASDRTRGTSTSDEANLDKYQAPSLQILRHMSPHSIHRIRALYPRLPVPSLTAQYQSQNHDAPRSHDLIHAITVVNKFFVQSLNKVFGSLLHKIPVFE